MPPLGRARRENATVGVAVRRVMCGMPGGGSLLAAATCWAGAAAGELPRARLVVPLPRDACARLEGISNASSRIPLPPEQLANEPEVAGRRHAGRIQLHDVRVPQLGQRLHLPHKRGGLLPGLRLHPLDRHAAAPPGGTVHHACQGPEVGSGGWLGAARAGVCTCLRRVLACGSAPSCVRSNRHHNSWRPASHRHCRAPN